MRFTVVLHPTRAAIVLHQEPQYCTSIQVAASRGIVCTHMIFPSLQILQYVYMWLAWHGIVCTHSFFLPIKSYIMYVCVIIT